MTTWNKDSWLEMLQLVNLSYEMTDICLEGEGTEERYLMKYGYVPKYVDDVTYFGKHFKRLKVMEKRDGNLHYTQRPKSLSDLLRNEEGPEDGINDPAGDPHPANVGKKAAEDGESQPDVMSPKLRDYEWVGRFSDYGAVEGNIFRRNGTYYMAFDGSQLRDLYSDWLATDIGGILGGSSSWLKGPLEEAYRIYRKALKCFDDLTENNVVFLGHSLGGGLAAALSAGIALGAFKQKKNEEGKFINDWTFSPDRSYNPEKPAEPLQEHVPVLTFNAPQMGWLFDKVVEEENPMSPSGSVKSEYFREERLSKVDVTAVRMNRDPVSDLRLYNLKSRDMTMNPEEVHQRP